MVMKDATPLTPPCAWAELLFTNVNNIASMIPENHKNIITQQIPFSGIQLRGYLQECIWVGNFLQVFQTGGWPLDTPYSGEGGGSRPYTVRKGSVRAVRKKIWYIVRRLSITLKSGYFKQETRQTSHIKSNNSLVFLVSLAHIFDILPLIDIALCPLIKKKTIYITTNIAMLAIVINNILAKFSLNLLLILTFYITYGHQYMYAPWTTIKLHMYMHYLHVAF